MQKFTVNFNGMLRTVEFDGDGSWCCFEHNTKKFAERDLTEEQEDIITKTVDALLAEEVEE